MPVMSSIEKYSFTEVAEPVDACPVTCPPEPFAMLDLGDAAVHEVVQRLRRAARSDVPVLLHGETGAGKELFARAIHDASQRRRGPFVAINCASIPEGLIESELFGHRAGAFTGASARGSKGLVEQANGGTLFLDEIGDMPLALQSRLLRLLAEYEIRPVGAAAPVKLDLRIVSATHRNLSARVSEGLFREDLLFRLQGLRVTLPPLRQRTDIGALAARLVAVESAKLGRAMGLSMAARQLISESSWPGNVRQLKQVLSTAVCLSETATITDDDLRQLLYEVADVSRPSPAVVPSPVSNDAGVDERAALLMSLKRNRWNVSATAAEFNAARTTIYRRMSKLGIVQPHLLGD